MADERKNDAILDNVGGSESSLSVEKEGDLEKKPKSEIEAVVWSLSPADESIAVWSLAFPPGAVRSFFHAFDLSLIPNFSYSLPLYLVQLGLLYVGQTVSSMVHCGFV